MKIFATSPTTARSRFWYFMSQLKRVKRANGEVIATREVSNPNTQFISFIRVQD